MSCTTQTALSLANRWLLSEIIHMRVPAVVDVWGRCLFRSELLIMGLLCEGCILVSSPDLIRRVYRFQYNARETRYWKQSMLGLVLGLGPRLGCIYDKNYGKCNGLAQTWYRIAENFENWWKIHFCGENFHKTLKSGKFPPLKVSSLESVLLYGMLKEECCMCARCDTLLLLAGETASWCAEVCQDWEAWIQRYVW